MELKEILLDSGIKNFLDAVDSVMNSNTFLLPFTEIDNKPRNNIELIYEYLHSDFFPELMYQNDNLRELYNFHDYDIINDDLVYSPTKDSWLTDNEIEVTEELDFEKFKALLKWYLTKSFSPYDKHLGELEAQILVDRFCERLIDIRTDKFGALSLKPNFLHNTG